MLHLRKKFITARRLEMGLAGWEGLYQAEMEELGILNIQDQVSKSQVRERMWWAARLVKSSSCLEYKIYEGKREAWAKENWKSQILEDLVSQAKKFHLYSGDNGEQLKKSKPRFRMINLALAYRICKSIGKTGVEERSIRIARQLKVGKFQRKKMQPELKGSRCRESFDWSIDWMGELHKRKKQRKQNTKFFWLDNYS